MSAAHSVPSEKEFDPGRLLPAEAPLLLKGGTACPAGPIALF